MRKIPQYYECARENENIFRAVLRDLRGRKEPFVPGNLDTESGLEDIFKKYSGGNRYGIFTILDFRVSEKEATISFEDVATLSGGGANIKYKIKEDSSVEYQGATSRWMS